MNHNSTSTMKKSAKFGLSLNTKQKCFDEEPIVIRQNSNHSYVIQNHPVLTDLTDSASSATHKYGKMFFKDEGIAGNFEDYSYQGDSYYIVQRSNGKEMQDRVTLKLEIIKY